MKDNNRTYKISLIITVFSIVFSLVGIIFAVMNLKLSTVDGKSTGSALTIFWGMIAIFFSNITLFIINRNKYKNSSK